MNLLRFLWSWYNPTILWEEDASLTLIVDLDGNTFREVGPGEKVNRLAFLGPGTVSPFGFEWPSKGIGVIVADGMLQEIGFYFGHKAVSEHGQFFGSFRHGGKRIRLTKETTEIEAKSLFGEPSSREQDDEEILLYYDSSERGMGLEFDLGGHLKFLGIYARSSS